MDDSHSAPHIHYKRALLTLWIHLQTTQSPTIYESSYIPNNYQISDLSQRHCEKQQHNNFNRQKGEKKIVPPVAPQDELKLYQLVAQPTHPNKRN